MSPLIARFPAVSDQDHDQDQDNYVNTSDDTGFGKYLRSLFIFPQGVNGAPCSAIGGGSKGRSQQ